MWPRPGRIVGQQGVSAAVARYLDAFPDLHFSAETVIEGNRAALVWQATGTHSGVFMHIPPTGRKVSVRGTAFLTIEGGKITRGVHVWDVAGLLRGLGCCLSYRQAYCDVTRFAAFTREDRPYPR